MTEPLEFDPYSDVFFNDPYDVYRRLRDDAPVYRNDHYGFYALSRYDDVVAAHRDWRTFTSTHGITIDMLTDPGSADAAPGRDRLDDLHGSSRSRPAPQPREPRVHAEGGGRSRAHDPRTGAEATSTRSTARSSIWWPTSPPRSRWRSSR